MKLMRGMHARFDGLTSLVLDNPLLAVVAGIGFSVSFQTVAALAHAHGLPGWPALYPVGIDVGILALVAESRMLITMKPTTIPIKMIKTGSITPTSRSVVDVTFSSYRSATLFSMFCSSPDSSPIVIIREASSGNSGLA